MPQPKLKDYSHTERLLAGAIQRMLKRQLSMAWEQWQFWYAEVISQQFKLAGAINRMLKRKLSMAWERWQFWYAEMIYQKEIADAAMRKFMR